MLLPLLGLVLATALVAPGLPGLVWAQVPPPKPGAPAPGQPPPWTPPVPPPPSQAHIPEPPPPGTVPLAPTARFELHPTLSLTEEYSDNFFLTAREKTRNFRSMLGPGFNLLVNEPNTKGTISTTVEAAYDTAVAQEVGFFSSLTAALQHTFTPRFSVTLTDAFTRSDEPSLADQFGLRFERRTFSSNLLSLAADWRVDIVETQGYYRLNTFSSDSDTTTHILGAGASSPIGPLTRGRLGYELSSSETTGRQPRESTGHLMLASLSRRVGTSNQVGASTSYSIQSLDDTRIWNVQLFTAYGLPPTLSLSGSVGYSLLNSDTQDNLSTVSTNSTLSYRLARVTISVKAFQDFRQTFTAGEDFGVVSTRSYEGSLLYQVTPLVSARLSVSFKENQPTGAANVRREESDTTLTGTIGLDWQLLRWLAMTLQYTRVERSKGGSGATDSGDISENRATFKLNAVF